MKTCGYCGRENEDSAIACRECGQSEFPETAEKARAVQPPAIIEPEPELPEPDVASGEEACLCPFCLFPNLPERQWCKHCGSPFNTAILDPFQSAIASGCMWRGVVRGRPRPVIFLIIWIWFPAVFVFGALDVLAGLLWGMSSELVVLVHLFFLLLKASLSLFCSVSSSSGQFFTAPACYPHAIGFGA